MPRRPGYEADDFLAAAVSAEEKRGGTALVASGDRDTFQLASDRTTILLPVRAGEMARIGPAEVRERYGVEPAQVPDFIALRGDPSDKLPGAPGVGADRRGVAHARNTARWKRCSQPAVSQRRPTASALSLHRHDGPESAASDPSQPETDLGQGCRAGAGVGAKSTCCAAGRACSVDAERKVAEAGGEGPASTLQETSKGHIRCVDFPKPRSS